MADFDARQRNNERQRRYQRDIAVRLTRLTVLEQTPSDDSVSPVDVRIGLDAPDLDIGRDDDRDDLHAEECVEYIDSAVDFPKNPLGTFSASGRDPFEDDSTEGTAATPPPASPSPSRSPSPEGSHDILTATREDFEDADRGRHRVPIRWTQGRCLTRGRVSCC